MTVPATLVATSPQEPKGKQLEEGWPFAITFASNPGITLWPEDIKMPGVKTAGNAIMTSTQFNREVETKAPPGLKEMTDADMSCSFNSASIADVYDQVGRRDAITITWPDGYAYVFWGFMETAEPEAFTPKKM